MDNYTATEQAYKNGYEQGLKDAQYTGPRYVLVNMPPADAQTIDTGVPRNGSEEPLLDETDKETILAMADNDMCISKAARELFLSRPGMWHRLERMKKRIGLDPMNFYDLNKLLALVQGKVV